jgi:hypothetical protein
MRSTTFVPNSSAEKQNPLRRRPAIAASLALLVFCFAFRCYRTYRVFNDTADEAVHIACGLEILQFHRYTAEAQHPPLARLALALPAYLAGLRVSEHWPLWGDSSREFYWHTLAMARLGNLIWLPFLIIYVYRWASQMHGPGAGVGAAVLVSFCPNLLAHASLATLDFGAAASTLIASYYFWRWSRQPGLRNCVPAALASGVAVLTKFSAVVELPAIAAAFFLIARWRRRPWLPSRRWYAALQRAAAFLAIVAGMIWAGYLFDVGPLPGPQFAPAEGSFGQYLEHTMERLAGRRALPAVRFWRGLLDVAGHNAHGHESYLLGRISQYGWWYYFPVVLAVKTTLPLLLLAAMSVAAWGVTTGLRPPAPVFPMAAAAVLLAICMSSHINLGVRHILAIYPFLALSAAGLFAGAGAQKGRRGIAAIAVALAGWHAAESLAAHPDYLAYFNESVRGHEDDYLLDSNLDWGQDLERLRRYLEQNGITTIYLSYFGRTDPARLGIRALHLPSHHPPTGWVAVSKAHIAGLTLAGHDLKWLRAHRPAARIGKSILVYYFPNPA